MGNVTKVGIYKTQQGYDQGKTTIPSTIIGMKNIKHGDNIVWSINEIGQIIITPKRGE